MKKTHLLIILMMVLLASIVTANEYTNAVQEQGTYVSGNFNQGLQTPPQTTTSKTIASPTLTPLVADLDGDGINEIVVMDAGVIRIYHGSSLTLDGASGTAITFYDSSNRPTSWAIADLNDDGKKEIIIPTLSANAVNIAFMNYNGTTLTNAFTITQAVSVAVGVVASGETEIGCDDVGNRCMILYSHTAGFAVTGTSQRWSASLFNLTRMGNATTEALTGDTANNHAFCLPHITKVSVDDINNNGVKDFTASILHVNDGGATDRVRLVSYENVDSNLTISNILSVTDTSSGNVADSVSNNCRIGVTGNTFTSPLVAELDGSSGNGEEIIFASMHNGNSFGMYAYHGIAGTLIDDFPEATFTDGTLTGNVFRADAFDHTGARSEFCTSGFVTNATSNKTSILCGSLVNTATGFDSANYDVVTNYNISSLRDGVWATLVGSSQQDHTSTAGFNGDGDYDEIVTTFGVYRLTKNFVDDAILEPVWYNQDHFNLSSQRNGAMIAVDVENVSASDLLYLTSGNLYYFNDGFTNSPANLTNIHINPCLNSTWKQNTSVNIDVTADDINNDDIHCQAFLYYGTPDQQFANDTGYFAHGVTHSFTFTAFNVTGTGTGRAECYDTHNPTLPDSEQFSFSVNVNGVVNGDCETNLNLIEEVVPPFTNTTITPATQNVITQLLSPINERTGLGMTVLWLLAMTIIGITATIAILVEGRGHTFVGVLTLAVVGMVEVILLIIGTFLGYIGFGVLLTVVIFGVAIVAGLIAKLLIKGV